MSATTTQFEAVELARWAWDKAVATGAPYAELYCLARASGAGAALTVEAGACVVTYADTGPVRYPFGWLSDSGEAAS